MSEKAATIFDHLSGITDKKISWDSLSESDRKSFSPYMINRWLSMNMNYLDVVNECQQYTIGQLSPRDTYKLYFDILPKQKSFNKYVKGKKSDKYNPELVDLLSNHFLISRKEVTDYLDITLDESKNTVMEIIKKYGKTDKEAAKLLKVEKSEK
jgi:hypothetical protein